MSKQKCLQRAARTPPWISTRRRLRMSKRPNNTRTPVASSAPLSSEAHPPASISIGARLAKVLFILNTRAGLDGILTCFALISSCAGAAIDARVVLVMGICNIFADALAMGLCQLRVSPMEKTLRLERARRRDVRRDCRLCWQALASTSRRSRRQTLRGTNAAERHGSSKTTPRARCCSASDDRPRFCWLLRVCRRRVSRLCDDREWSWKTTHRASTLMTLDRPNRRLETRDSSGE